MESPESLSVVNGRMRIIPAGSLPAPGHCAVCGSVERNVVDFGLDLDFYGAVLICVECLTNATQIMGLAAASTVEAPAVSPLSFMDVEAINEYVRKSLDATNRLISILPDSAFDFDISADEGDEVSDDTLAGESDTSEPSPTDSSGPGYKVPEPLEF